jgi:hypothetical protein
MAYEMKDNSGSLFRVPPDKLTKETAAPYEGEFKMICPHCAAESRGWVKAWVNESKVGKFFGLRFKFRDKQPYKMADADPQQKPAARPAYGEDDREIPF